MTSQKKTSIDEKQPYYMAPEVVKQLESAMDKVIRGDQDRVIPIDGNEGSGKSTLGFQLAYKVDPTFCLDDIVFTGDQLSKRIKELAVKKIKYKAIVFDEAFNGLSSKSALSKQNKQLVQLFMECRQLNLFIFIILPSVFLLEKYIALFRSHALFHVFISKRDIKRRYYKIYNRKTKKTLFLLGQKYLTYNKPYIRKSYRFYAKMPPTIDKEAYLEKKLKAFHSEEKGEEFNKYKAQRDFILKKFYEETNMTHTKMGILFKECVAPINRSLIGQICVKRPVILAN